MPNKKASRLGSSPTSEPFTTIDDLAKQAEDLVTGLHRLGEYKYPLDIRRGNVLQRLQRVVGRGVRDDMTDRNDRDRESIQIKGGSQTYFVDVETTRDGTKKYMKITSSKMKGKDGKPERSDIYVWPKDVQEFADAVSKMAAKLT